MSKNFSRCLWPLSSPVQLSCNDGSKSISIIWNCVIFSSCKLLSQFFGSISVIYRFYRSRTKSLKAHFSSFCFCAIFLYISNTQSRNSFSNKRIFFQGGLFAYCVTFTLVPISLLHNLHDDLICEQTSSPFPPTRRLQNSFLFERFIYFLFWCQKGEQISTGVAWHLSLTLVSKRLNIYC